MINLTQNFKNIMNAWPTGVAVISTSDNDGRLYGFTANTISSVSLDPLLISFCISKKSPTIEPLRITKKFIISILSHEQKNLAQHFAKTSEDKFLHIDYKMSANTQCPYLENALGYIELDLQYEYEGGDHLIMIGSVINIVHNQSQKPLLYYNRSFGSVVD